MTYHTIGQAPIGVRACALYHLGLRFQTHYIGFDIDIDVDVEVNTYIGIEIDYDVDIDI